MPLLQRAAALQEEEEIKPQLCFFLTGLIENQRLSQHLPGHRSHHHAGGELLVVLSAYDVAAVVTQRDVRGLGVERAGVCGRHRQDAQVSYVPEGGVQVVDGGAVRVQVTGSSRTPRNLTTNPGKLRN